MLRLLTNKLCDFTGKHGLGVRDCNMQSLYLSVDKLLRRLIGELGLGVRNWNTDVQ